MALGSREEPFEQVGRGDGVVVEEEDPATLLGERSLEPEVAAAGNAEVGVAAQDARGRSHGAERGGGIWLTAIVDEEQVCGGGLREE